LPKNKKLKPQKQGLLADNIKLITIMKKLYYLQENIQYNKQKAFTLVELVVTIGILTMVVGIIFALYWTSQKFYQLTESQAEMLQNSRVVLERMNREIRQAQEIVTALSQSPDNPSSQIEFQDGHHPSPYDYLNSLYYYIRYYVSTTTGEMHRQYLVYCFDECSQCSNFFKWNDIQIINGNTITTHPCVLEDKIVGEFIKELKIWGANIITIVLQLEKSSRQIEIQTNVFTRNF